MGTLVQPETTSAGETATQTALVLRAELNAVPGLENPGAHQTYRHPRVELETRVLGDLRPNFVRVEMIYAGICGTDLHALQSDPVSGYMRTSSPAEIPPEGRILGHEGLGRIIEVGAEVQNLRRGHIVAFDSIIVCHKCDRCERGLLNQCREARLLGLQEDGLFANRVDVPASIAHDVSDSVRDDDDAQALALLEPAGVAYIAARNGRVAIGESVLVLGAGPIGVYCAMLARIAFGAREVHVVEPLEFRRNFVSRWADRVLTPEEFVSDARGCFDVAFEASGDLRNVDLILPQTNAGGRIVILGRSGESMQLAHVDRIITNAISLIGSRGHLGGSFDALHKLYAEGRIFPAEIVTDVVEGIENLERILRTPEMLAERNCKVLVKF